MTIHQGFENTWGVSDSFWPESTKQTSIDWSSVRMTYNKAKSCPFEEAGIIDLKKKKKKKDRHKNCYPIFTILTFRKILRDFSAELLTCCWLAIMWGVQIQEWKGNCRRQKCLPNMGENIFNSRTLLVLQSSQRRETFLMFWS